MTGRPESLRKLRVSKSRLNSQYQRISWDSPIQELLSQEDLFPMPTVYAPHPAAPEKTTAVQPNHPPENPLHGQSQVASFKCQRID